MISLMQLFVKFSLVDFLIHSQLNALNWVFQKGILSNSVFQLQTYWLVNQQGQNVMSVKQMDTCQTDRRDLKQTEEGESTICSLFQSSFSKETTEEVR